MLCCESVSWLAGGSWAFHSVGSSCVMEQMSERRAVAPTWLVSAALPTTRWWLYTGHLWQHLLRGVFLEEWPVRACWSLAYHGCWIFIITPSDCPSISGLSVCFMNTHVPSKQTKGELVLLREPLWGNPSPHALLTSCSFLNRLCFPVRSCIPFNAALYGLLVCVTVSACSLMKQQQPRCKASPADWWGDDPVGKEKDCQVESLIYHLSVTLTGTIFDGREKNQLHENARIRCLFERIRV